MKKFLFSFTERNAWWFAIALIPTVSLIMLAKHFYPYFVDDAFISLRYADRFLNGKGLTWNDGEHVEGYSNLLLILLVSLLGAFDIELVVATRAVCLLGTLSTFAALFYFARKNRMHWVVPLAAAMFLARSRYVAIWSIGGLEASLHMALITWVAVLGWQRFQRNDARTTPFFLAFLLGLIALNRPDGILFIGVFGLLFAWLAVVNRSPAHLREALSIPLLALIAPLGQLMFRLYYYHDIVPNTFYVKVSLNTQRLHEGLDYVGWGLYWLLPFIACISLLLLLAVFRSRLRLHELCCATLFLLAPTVAWLLGVAAAGGDGFHGYRHMLPVAGLLAMLLMAAMQAALSVRPLLACLIVVAGLSGSEFHQRGKMELESATWHVWEWKCKEIGENLHQWFAAEQPLVAVTAAGALPYYSKLPTLDTFGLSDPYLARHKPASFGSGHIGHELFNSQYIFSRRPDIIVLHYGIPDNYPMPERKKLNALYELRWIALPKYGPAALWVRKDSPIYGKLLAVTNP